MIYNLYCQWLVFFFVFLLLKWRRFILRLLNFHKMAGDVSKCQLMSQKDCDMLYACKRRQSKSLFYLFFREGVTTFPFSFQTSICLVRIVIATRKRNALTVSAPYFKAYTKGGV